MDTPYWLKSIRERRLKRRLPGSAEGIEDALAGTEKDLQALEEAQQHLLKARECVVGVVRGGSYARHAIVTLNSISTKLYRLHTRLYDPQSEIFQERRFLVERSEVRRG